MKDNKSTHVCKKPAGRIPRHDLWSSGDGTIVVKSKKDRTKLCVIEHHKRQVLQASYDYFAASADCEKLMGSIAQDFAANEITATVLKSERNRRVREYQCGLDFTSITAVRRFPGTKKTTVVKTSDAAPATPPAKKRKHERTDAQLPSSLYFPSLTLLPPDDEF